MPLSSRALIFLLIVSHYPLGCAGFANRLPKSSNSLVDILLGRPEEEDDVSQQTKTAQDGAQLLKELDLTASTEPALASAPQQQIPALLAASTVAVARAASGTFGLDYQLSVAPRDPSKYSRVNLGDGYQLQETCYNNPPELPLILYDNESCPFCRSVREACSMLSLTVRFRPVPRNGLRFRPDIEKRYRKGVSSFPFLMDPNSGVELFDSGEIIKYLFARYGPPGRNDVPWSLRQTPLVVLTAGLGLLPRFGAGGSYQSSKTPRDPLVLWAYEGSPFAKIVRETLCSLELEHTVIFTPRGSSNVQKLFDKVGRYQVPYLEDPNTGVALFESEAIVEYLTKMYAVASAPVTYM